jgi:acetoacetate decarboxylase
MVEGKYSDILSGILMKFKDMISGPGIPWENARFVLAEVPLRREAARHLPMMLSLDDPPRGTLFIVYYTKTSFTVAYHEAALLINVRHPLGSGLHCPWMIVDDDTSMIYGRELLAYPKKMGSFTFEEQGDDVRASLTRRGVTVLAMEGKKRAPQEMPAPVFTHRTFNVGGPGSFLLVNPIWTFRAHEVIHESREMELAVTVNHSEWDPISELIAGPPTSARFVAMDILGSKDNFIAGLSGPRFIMRNFNLRFR